MPITQMREKTFDHLNRVIILAIMFDFVTAGESHGKSLVAIVSGVPLGLEIDLDFINRDLRRRQAGYGRGGRMKIRAIESMSFPVFALGKPSEVQSPYGSKIATGPTGKTPCQ